MATTTQPLSPAALSAARLVSGEEDSGTRSILTTAISASLHAKASMPVAFALSSTTAARAAVFAGAGPAGGALRRRYLRRRGRMS